MMRNDDLRCQEIGVFDMVDHLGGCLGPQLTGIDVYGCDSADLDQDTKEVGSDVFVLSRISDE